MKFGFMKFWIIFSIMWMSIFICNCEADQSPKQEIIASFDLLSKSLDVQKLNRIKISQHDSTGKSLQLFSKEIDIIYSRLIINPKNAAFLDSIVPNQEKYQKLYLGVAFQAYLNKKEILSKDVAVDMNRIYEYYNNNLR